MRRTVTTTILSVALLASGFCAAQVAAPEASAFSYETERLTGARPWTAKEFQNDPRNFQFVIIGDRTGGANVLETFQKAMPQINLLEPEFVINVGDLIEGYSDQAAELNMEWNEVDSWLGELDMPFFKTPGNHDIANTTAREVWRERYGATYYSFLYKDVLFMVLDTEYDRPAPPPDMKEKIELYNRLQVEDPPKAQAMLAEFMSDESVIAGLSTPVEFDEKQLAWIRQTLTDHPDVRWTFLFMHEHAGKSRLAASRRSRRCSRGENTPFSPATCTTTITTTLTGMNTLRWVRLVRRSIMKVPATSITSCG